MTTEAGAACGITTVREQPEPDPTTPRMTTVPARDAHTGTRLTGTAKTGEMPRIQYWSPNERDPRVDFIVLSISRDVPEQPIGVAGFLTPGGASEEPEDAPRLFKV